ncbi:hypothetical protein [Weissella cibaria]|uniref:hypothetical protein n=1 Tax=Weissella cibaria TaxID=137591 RepID=UPI0022E3C4EE|nr:hypothetical protein [Weissella cibaria]
MDNNLKPKGVAYAPQMIAEQKKVKAKALIIAFAWAYIGDKRVAESILNDMTDIEEVFGTETIVEAKKMLKQGWTSASIQQHLMDQLNS